MDAKPKRRTTSKKQSTDHEPLGARPRSSARYPILEFDETAVSVIEPSRIRKRRDVPKHCVVCFFQDVIDDVCDHGATIVATMRSEIGEHPMYEIDFAGERLAVIHPGIGAPMGAAMLEEAIAFGCRKFIACGGAGALDGSLAVGHLVIPTSAVRDEGTSYHYLPPAREVAPSPKAVAAIKKVLKARGHDFMLGKTWTTDAIYRETRKLVDRRRSEGCLTVEMEAAAFFAVAKFRGVEFGQLLYAGDDLSGEWDPRNWTRHQIRERVFALSAEACLRL